MQELDFISANHTKTQRNYVQRVVEHDKAECATKAKEWGYDYWDGDRRYGYGGMVYDGRWRPIAERIARHYGLAPGMKVLDVGCGKGFLLYELTQAVPGLEVAGLDISAYGVEHAKPEIADTLRVGNCTDLPWPDDHFDFVFSVNVFHNLYNYELESAVTEMERVGKDAKYICVESYRTEAEKANLLYWQLTCETFMTPKEWLWLFDRLGYTGDYGFIYFE